MTIQFSEKTQSFYDTDLEYVNQPSDLVDVDDNTHGLLLSLINSGCYVFSDKTFTAPKPSLHHKLVGKDWVDNRTSAEKTEAKTQELKPLTRRQFKLALLNEGLLEQVELSINNIEDNTERTRMQIEYTEANEFHRTSDAVATMITLLGLDEDQVNTMWEKALTL